jgi:hypothetical protein
MAGLRILLLLVGVAFWAPPAAAGEAPACVASTAGTVACIAERLCRCAFVRGGSMVEREAGYRWDCGLLRPHCHRPPTLQDRSTRPSVDIDLLVPLDRRPRQPKHRPPLDPPRPGDGRPP